VGCASPCLPPACEPLCRERLLPWLGEISYDLCQTCAILIYALAGKGCGTGRSGDFDASLDEELSLHEALQLSMALEASERSAEQEAEARRLVAVRRCNTHIPSLVPLHFRAVRTVSCRPTELARRWKDLSCECVAADGR
jgi:hypothetical protein